MDLYEFNENALKTESRVDEVNAHQHILLDALVAFCKSAEILDAIKKNVFYGKPIDIRDVSNNAHYAVQRCVRISRELDWTINTGGDEMGSCPIDINPRLFHALIGICTEAGEIGEALAVALSDEKELDTVNVLEEFGDIDWYKAIAFDAWDVDPHDPLNAVINKLRLRYPDKFTSEAAINRDLDAERELLERNLE